MLVETSDGVRFTKLRGAGQGTGALVAEIIVGALCDALGLNTPARSLVRIPRGVESTDRNDELRWLLDASEGLNLGFAYLDGARNLELSQLDDVNRDDAAAIVWLDGLVMNPDRTRRNPNLMWWRDRLWLIDHGAALGFQYAWSSVSELSTGLPMPTHEPHLLARPRHGPRRLGRHLRRATHPRSDRGRRRPGARRFSGSATSRREARHAGFDPSSARGVWGVPLEATEGPAPLGGRRAAGPRAATWAARLVAATESKVGAGLGAGLRKPR